MTRLTLLCFSCIVISLKLAGSSYAKIDSKAVIGIWFLDDDKGGVAKDSSGNGRDGEIIGELKVVKAKFNQGFEFDGVLGNYVSVPHDNSLNLAKFTITYWCKMGVSGFWQIPVLKVDGAAGGAHRNVDFQTPPAGGEVSVYFSQGANQWRGANGTTVVSDKEWHHIAGSYNLDTLLLYVDGVLEAEGDHDGKPDFMDDPLILGSGEIWPFLGIIDDVGIFNQALSADDIKNIMNRGLDEVLGLTDVSPSGKLTNTWGELKQQ